MACYSPFPRLGCESEAAAVAAALAFVSTDRRQRASEAGRLRVWKGESRSRSTSTWHDTSGADSNPSFELQLSVSQLVDHDSKVGREVLSRHPTVVLIHT